MTNVLTAVPSVDAIGDLPLSVRQALVPDLMRYSRSDTARGIVARVDEQNARLAFNLDPYTGDERPQGKFWFTYPNDIHPAVRGMYDAVLAGTFTLSDTAPTPTEGKNRADAGNALAVMRRREAMALADRAAAEQQVRDQAARIAALEERVQHASGAVPVPWGPSHPDWDAFWLQAARDAERAGNCGEYDRHAEEMGGPTRYDLRSAGEDLDGRRYTHYVDVTVSFRVAVNSQSNSDDYDEDMLHDAIREYIENVDTDSWLGDYSATAYSVERDYDSEEDGAGRVWTNPGRS